jgi:hypothetical protein
MAHLVEVDNRKRVSLGAVAREPGTQYMAEVDDDGVIVLTPAVIMSEVEARLLQRPDILAAIERSRSTDGTTRRPVRRR